MSLRTTDFFGGSEGASDFLSEDARLRTRTSEEANELSTAASVVNGDATVDNRVQSVNNLEITGDDPNVEAAATSSQNLVENVRRNDVLERGTPEEIALALPSMAKPKRKTEASLISVASTNMVEEMNTERELEERLDVLNQWIFEKRELNTILDNFEQKISDDTSWGQVLGDFAEALAPIYSPIAERSQRVEVSEGNPFKNFLLRSGGTDDIANAILNAPSGKQAELLTKLLDTVEESQTLIGNKNSLFMYEMVADIRNKINEGETQADKFSSASVLSEVVGTLDYLEFSTAKSVVKFLVNKATGKSNVASAVEASLPAREGKGSLLDAVNRQSNDAAQKYLSSEDIETVAKQLGNSVDEVIDRTMPMPAGKIDDLGLKGDFLERDPSVLLSELERKAIAGNVARKMEKASGNAAEARLELSETFTSDTENSLGGLTLRFGSKDESAFTYEEALAAANNFVGEEVKLVAKNRTSGGFRPARKKDKEVFLETKQEVFFDPKRDAGSQELAFGVVGGFRDNKYLLNPWRRYDGNILRRYFASKSVDRGVQADIAKRLKPITNLAGRDADNFNDLIRKGDANGAVFTKEQANVALDGNLKNKVWRAYENFLEVQDDLYRIENVSHRRSLDQGGFKYLQIEGSDEFVRPILKPKLSRKEGTSNVFGKAIDAENGKVVELSQEVLDSLYANGGLIARSRGTRAIGDEGFNQIIVRSRNDIKPLPAFTLNKRKGYYARFYGDTGYLATRSGKKLLNGIEVESREVLGIFPDNKSANEWKLAQEDDGINIVFSRESNDFLQGMGGVTEFGWQPINQRKRGQQLMGPEGNPARTLDPMEALARQYDAIERKLGKDYTELMRSRWTKQYNTFLKGEYKNSFPPEFSTDIFDPDQLKLADNVLGDGRDVFREAKSWHDHIRTAEGVKDEPLFANFNRNLQLHIERLIAKDKPIQAQAYKVLDKSLSALDLKRITTGVFILGRPLFQIPTNMMQLSYLAIRSPISGTLSAAQTIPFGTALLFRNTAGWKGIKNALAKAFNMNGAEFERMVDGFMQSGLYNPKLSDDFLRYSKSSFGDTAKTLKRSQLAKWGNPIKHAANVSRTAQSGSIMYANMGGYIQSYKEAKKALGRAPATAKERSSILAEADLLLQSQNSIDEFAFQARNNPLSFMFQFMQHVTKLFYDMVLDPTVKLVTNKSVGQNPSKWATTRSQAAVTLGGVMSLFGIQGLTGQDVGIGATDGLRRFVEDQGIILDDESWDWFRGGLVNVLMDSFIDGSVNVTGRITPAGVVDSAIQMAEDPFTLEWMGAAGAATDVLYTSAQTAKAFMMNPEMDTTEAVLRSVGDFASIFAGIDDITKAIVAYNTGIAISGSGVPVGQSTQDEAILRAFSFRNWDEIYSNKERSAKFSRQDKVKRLGDIWVNYTALRLKDIQGLEWEQQLAVINNDITPVIYASAGEGLGDDVLSYVRSRMLNERDLLGNRINQALQFTTYEQALKNLKTLKMRGVGDPDSIQWQIETLQELIDRDITVE